MRVVIASRPRLVTCAWTLMNLIWTPSVELHLQSCSELQGIKGGPGAELQ